MRKIAIANRIDYFYSIKIIDSESVREFSDLKKLKAATYDMSSIIRHEIPVKTYKYTRRSKQILWFSLGWFPLIALVLVLGILLSEDFSDVIPFLVIFVVPFILLGILIVHYKSKSMAWDKKVADDRGITTEEVKKYYTIVKASAWVKFNKMISKKANDEIQKFKQLFDDGVISQEEFEKKKKELLDL